MSSSEGSAKVIVIALAANLGIATAKFIGWLLTSSASLLAEAIHSLVDSTNQILLLIGSKKAKQPATEKHPLGYGRETFFWSFIVAILLFSLGGLFAIYEGVHKLRDHSEMSSPIVGLGILIVSLALEGFSFAACLKEVRSQNKYSSLGQWLRQTTASELLVIFTEDAAALGGLLLATLGLLLTWLTANPIWDAIGSIAVGSLLVIVAIFLAIEIKSLIIGEAPDTDFREFLVSQIGQFIPGGKLLRLISLQLGAHEVLISYKIHPGEIQDVKILIEAINRIEREVKMKYPEVRWQFVEPDFVE